MSIVHVPRCYACKYTSQTCDFLNEHGKQVIFSEWGMGVAKTAILYAANNADMSMMKMLVK